VTAGLEVLFQEVHDATGMEFLGGRAAVAESRIRERMSLLELSDCSSYRDRLKADRSELASLVEALAVNETFFFRHPIQFETLGNELLPKIIKPGRTLRIWSAGCANGCEPYSIVIACLEAMKMLGHFAFEVIASDLDTQALAEARRAEYGERAVTQEMPSVLRDRYFETLSDDRWRPIDAVRRPVSFSNINLVADPYPLLCDVVFCRNVLYYFSPAARSQVIRRIRGRYLFLSPTESLSGFETLFQSVDLKACLYESR